MDDLAESVDRVAIESGFSGVVRVDRDDEVVLAAAYGMADRAHGLPNRVDTRFALASGNKGFTALVVASLIDEGILELATTARSVLGADLPLIDDRVTVEQLLGHRSGIGDFVDEDEGGDIDDHVLTVPVHELATTEQYLQVLDGHPTKFEPDERFSYCNGGYVALVLIAERAAGVPFADLVARRVCEPAGMADTAYLRSDELPGDAAIGYLSVDGPRSNVLHLPVLGSGDGGMYSTAADVHAFWRAFTTGRIVPSEWVERMLLTRSAEVEGAYGYGLGFWVHRAPGVAHLEGYDAGVSFRTVHDRDRRLTHTVVSNWSDGAWPVTKRLGELLDTERSS